MGYDISGFIADQRLTNDDIDQMFDGVEAEGITKFEGVTAGVVDVIRADAYTLGWTRRFGRHRHGHPELR